MSSLTMAIVFLLFEFSIVFSPDGGFSAHSLCLLPRFIGYIILIRGCRSLWQRAGYGRKKLFIYICIFFETARFLGELFMYGGPMGTMIQVCRLISVAAALYMTKIINELVRKIETEDNIEMAAGALNRSWYWLLVLNALFFIVSAVYRPVFFLLLITYVFGIGYCTRIFHSKKMFFKNVPNKTLEEKYK